jgi:aryl-alcohol dehydrogenase-like predicted oxidoreductase
MGLTSFYGSKLPDPEIIEMIEKVSEVGINFIDTATFYSYLDNTDPDDPKTICQEEILGKAIKKVGRDKFVIATKTAMRLTLYPNIKLEVDGDPTFLREQCEASLKRLGVDCIDLLYLARIDQSIPIEVTMYEMKKLVEEGKVKYLGLSECSANTLRRAHKIHPITAIQMEYSLWCRGIEKGVLPTCKELGIGLVAYSPLGRGFFGGSHKKELEKSDFRQYQGRFKSEKNHQMYEALTTFAETKGVSVPQLALAWVEAQQDRAAGVVAIPGTTKEKNLLSNIESLNANLSKEDIETIEKIVPWEKTEGERYQGHATRTWETDQNPELTAELAKKWNIPF